MSIKKNPTGQEVLDLPMLSNDAGARTIREYLISLLYQVWDYGEAFDGKRPFGNTGWHIDLYYTLVINNFVEGSIDEDNWLTDLDRESADSIIFLAIESLH